METHTYKFIPKAAIQHGKKVKPYQSGGKRWIPLLVLGFVGVAVVCMIWVLSSKKEFKQTIMRQKAMQRVDEDDQKNRIFVSIASYRDPECGKTINSLYTNADHPFAIDVGVCQQNSASDEDCIAVYESVARAWSPMVYTDQIGVIRVPHEEATGPCWARDQIESKLYEGQPYFLQIDSHMRFCKGWDTFLTHELLATGDDRAILTGYPPEKDLSSTFNLEYQTATFLKPRFGDEIRFPVFEGQSVSGIPMKPFPTLGWSGCFSFSRGELHKIVPYLRNVSYLFFGEEFTMGCLYHMFGYNMYAPTKMPCVTTFDRSYRHTFWEIQKKDRRDIEKQSVNYIYNLLGFVYDAEKKSLKSNNSGPVVDSAGRTVNSWLHVLGVDIEKGTITPHGRAGVSQQPREDEILTKYGSNTHFLKIISF